MCAMNQFGPEDRLCRALRRLAQESGHNAPPELELALAGAFRAHHRRRKIRIAAVALVATVGLFSAMWLIGRPSQTAKPQLARHDATAPNAAISAAPNNIDGSRAETKKTVKHGSRRRTSTRQPQVAARETGDFLPLPSYDPSVAVNNGLQIIRVRMPIQDLRLVGAPVNAAMPNRQVLADFVVGQDGTPYAVRLVQ